MPFLTQYLTSKHHETLGKHHQPVHANEDPFQHPTSSRLHGPVRACGEPTACLQLALQTNSVCEGDRNPTQPQNCSHATQVTFQQNCPHSFPDAVPVKIVWLATGPQNKIRHVDGTTLQDTCKPQENTHVKSQDTHPETFQPHAPSTRKQNMGLPESKARRDKAPRSTK